MTRSHRADNPGVLRPKQEGKRPSPISLRHLAPAEWRRDLPAFPGDPFMDWESRPEPPREPRWMLVERTPNQNGY